MHLTASDSKSAEALKEYEAAVARSEATRASLEDQVQKPAASETEPQHTQQAASQVESEAVKDAASVEHAVKAQEDDERDLDDARVSEASQQADEQPTPRHTGSSQADTVKAQSAPEQSLTQQHAHA